MKAPALPHPPYGVVIVMLQMCARSSIRGVLLAVLLLAVSPVSARGLSGQVLLAFAETYTAPDGSTCTHRGADIAMAGTAVQAPVAGTVRFAGRVPGPHGGSVLAITIEAAEGAVTMLPFESLETAAGDTVAAGDGIGRLADSGDPSSPGAHLHLGLKRGSVYVDPTDLLAAPTHSSSPEPKPHAEPVEGRQTDVGARAAAPAPAPAAAVQPNLATQGGAGAKVAVAAAPPVTQPSAEPAGEAAPVGAGLPAGVTVPGSTVVGEGRGGAVGDARSPAVKGGVAPRTSMPRVIRSALAPAMVALVASALSAACFLVPLLITRRAVASRVVQPPVSDRLGTMLQHLKAGDTLRGLTSCSGPTAFTVPGPPAQRR